MEWRHKNLITLEGWTREELGFFLDQTEYMEELLNRPIKKVPALRGKIVMNCFFENSTRTRASFEIAGKVLSADVINWSSSGSSASKGETLRDTVWTLEAMAADAVVVRHGEVGVPDYLAKKLTKASVFNAGDGTNGHPTQALLDLYTARQKLGNLEGAKMAIIGDVLHSRVGPSDIHAFRKLGDHVTLSGPATSCRKHGSLGVGYFPTPARRPKGGHTLLPADAARERQEDGLIPPLTNTIAAGRHDSLGPSLRPAV